MEFSAGPAPSRLWFVLLLLPTLGAVFGAYVLAAPTHLAYRLTPSDLVIEASLGGWDQGRTVPRAQITQAEPVTLAHGHRDAGTGMPGYCQGQWSFEGIRSAWIATNCSSAAVALMVGDETIIVSPADRDAFIAAVQTPGATLDVTLPQSDRPSVLLVVALALLLVPLGMTFLLLRVFRPLVYGLEGDVLVVPRTFGAHRVSLRDAEITRGELHRAMRLGGTAIPGFYLGYFRNKDGGFHAAATRMDGGLFVTADRRVYITPQDEAGFLAAALRAGARVSQGLLP